MKFSILYEDNHIIAVDKPAGMLVQQDYSGSDSLLDHVKQYIKESRGKPGNVYLGLVHRLDRPVSGAVVLAKTSKAASRLSEAFKSRNVEKLYTALVHSGDKAPGKGWTTLESELTRVRGKSRESRSGDYGIKPSKLEYSQICSSRCYSLLLIRLHTGRKHQIRAQMSAAGMPVVGDREYGSTETVSGGICLHSCLISFKHPVRDDVITVKSSAPSRITELIKMPAEDIQKIIDAQHSETISCT